MQLTLLTKRIPEVPVDRIPQTLQTAGFSGVNLCIREGHPVNPDNVAAELPAAARVFADAGLALPLVTTRGDLTDPAAPDVEPTLAACAEAGVPLVKIGYWIVKDDYHALLAGARKAMVAFARLAEKHRVRILLHTHSGDFLTNTAAATLALVSDFDPRCVGIYADVGHLHLTGEPARMAFDIVKDYLAVVGMQDSLWARTDAAWERSIVPLGEGMVDWNEIKTLLENMSFQGPLAFHADHFPKLDVPFIDHAKQELDRWRRV